MTTISLRNRRTVKTDGVTTKITDLHDEAPMEKNEARRSLVTDYERLASDAARDDRKAEEWFEPVDFDEVATRFAECPAKLQCYLLDRWLNGAVSINKWMTTRLEKSRDFLRDSLEKNDGGEVATNRLEYHTEQVNQVSEALKTAAPLITAMKQAYVAATGKKWLPYVPSNKTDRAQTASAAEAKAALAKVEAMLKRK